MKYYKIKDDLYSSSYLKDLNGKVGEYVKTSNSQILLKFNFDHLVFYDFNGKENKHMWFFQCEVEKVTVNYNKVTDEIKSLINLRNLL